MSQHGHSLSSRREDPPGLLSRFHGLALATTTSESIYLRTFKAPADERPPLKDIANWLRIDLQRLSPFPFLRASIRFANGNLDPLLGWSTISWFGCKKKEKKKKRRKERKMIKSRRFVEWTIDSFLASQMRIFLLKISFEIPNRDRLVLKNRCFVNN